jgi:hypothetical protein
VVPIFVRFSKSNFTKGLYQKLRPVRPGRPLTIENEASGIKTTATTIKA